MDDSIPRLLDRGGEGAEHQKLGRSRLSGGRSCLRCASDQHSHSYYTNNKQVKNRSLVHDFFSSMANRIWMKSLYRNIRLAELDLQRATGGLCQPSFYLCFVCLLSGRLSSGSMMVAGGMGISLTSNPKGLAQAIATA